MNAPAYAALVADCAARRRLLSLAERVSGQAMDPEQRVEEILAGFAGTVETIPLSFEVPGTVEAGDLIAEPDDFDWLVPNWIERGDRILWTAAEGVGKSEMQLQLAVMLAAGIHPFQRHNVRRLRVLLVDLENSRRQLRRRIRRLIAAAGDRYQGGLTVWPRIDGINLRDPRDFRALDALCEKHHPELVVLGPLYKAFRTKGGERVTEETPAQEAAQALDRLRARHGCALSIEAHAPHGDHGDREGLRPYGASLWLRWPEFGIGMKRLPGERSVELKHWRGARDRDRDWPEVLAEGRLWPWEPIERSVA